MGARRDKVDFRRALPELYQPRNRDWQLVDVPDLTYLMIDGAGDPNTSPRYAAAVAALYSVAYPVKFASRRELDRDYVVPVLEGLWYAEDLAVFEARDKASFAWTMMIMQPDWITVAMYETALAAAARKNPDLPHHDVRLGHLAEGRCLQLLHVGSYDEEGPALHRLHHDLMPAQGVTFDGHHHEIYLSDPRRVATDKLRTILRQPVRSLGSR